MYIFVVKESGCATRHSNERFRLDIHVIKTFSPEMTSCVICLIRKKVHPNLLLGNLDFT